MERLTERLAIARQALATLQEGLREPKNRIVRDASIQRFECTFEAVWKAGQLYLRVEERLAAGSPKAVIRASLQVGLWNEEQARAALRMADDRNLTVHTYNESLAEAIYSRLPEYASLMEQWPHSLEQRRTQADLGL